jgi:hypothetical protein
VATLNLAPGYTQFIGLCAKANVGCAQEQQDPIICLLAQAASDDEDSESEDKYDEQKE